MASSMTIISAVILLFQSELYQAHTVQGRRSCQIDMHMKAAELSSVSISVYLEHLLTPETDLEYWWMFMPSIVYVFTRGWYVALQSTSCLRFTC